MLPEKTAPEIQSSTQQLLMRTVSPKREYDIAGYSSWVYSEQEALDLQVF
jgi:hypothetical protein